MKAAARGAQIKLTYLGAGQTVVTSTVGANGNRIGIYGIITGAQTESWAEGFQQMRGGTSPSQWRGTVDFSTLHDESGVLIPTHSVRKMRWTYSTCLQPGQY